ncbi:MAG: cation diffusion facilitator family transporter [Thermoprotei archaeon]
MFEEGRRRTLVSVFVFSIMAVAKLLSGVIFGSVIIFADGIHSVSDVLMAIMVYISLALAERPPSSKFPFGLYKLENMASLIVAIVIGLAAIEIGIDSLRVFRVEEPWIPIAVEGAAMAGSYLLMLYLKASPGVKLGSIQAQSAHAYQDVLSSLVVILGIIGEWLSITPLAIGAALLVAFYILFEAYKIGKGAFFVLLDVSDENMATRIKDVVSKVDGVIGLHEIRVRSAGPYYFVEMHLEAPPSYSVKEADQLADVVEKEIKDKLPSVSYVSIHVEPGSFSGKWIVALLEQSDNTIRGHAATAPLIKIIDTETGKVELIENPTLKEERRKGLKLAKELKSRGVEVIIVREIGEGMLSALKGEGIMVLRAPTINETEVLGMFKKGELQPAEASLQEM